MSGQFNLDLRENRTPDLPTVQKRTRKAIKQVTEHASPEWLADALKAVELTCRLREDFISDDVWELSGLESTFEDRALGAVFQRAKRLGLCEKTDRVRPSKRSNLAGKPVWRSLVYRGGA